ncbi:hypothetical protein EBZ39_00025 [bacterium]|nr:hypothetical protein [bacterium]
MTSNEQSGPVLIDIDVPGTSQSIVDILHDYYSTLDSGEVRAKLEGLEPNVWTSEEFSKKFDVQNIHPPYVDVIRKEDGVAGTVMFIDRPRFYFTFNAGLANNDATS